MSFPPCSHTLWNKNEIVVGGTISGLPQYVFTGANSHNLTVPLPPLVVQKLQDSAPNQHDSHQKSNISSIRTDQFQEEVKEERSSCRTCLYTGVATCTGISLYFASLYSELPSDGPRAAVKDVVKQKRFLLGGSAIWAAAGMYRLYLG